MEFIGNKKAADFLNKTIENGSFGHAYLFSGPEHVGKFSLAKVFSFCAIAGKSFLEKDAGYVDKDALLDLVVVAPEVVEKGGVSKQRDIPIETIRDVQQTLSLFPYHGKYKILIVDDAHKLTIAAQNALLKTLEEPNPTTMIILVTHEVDRVLPTIQSRCQPLNFSLVGDGEMGKFFPGQVAELSFGRPGLAQKIGSDKEELDARLEAQGQLATLVAASLGERFKIAEELSKDAVKTLERLDMWTWILRKKALEEENGGRDEKYAVIGKIRESIALLKRTNANARLVLETLFMDM